MAKGRQLGAIGGNDPLALLVEMLAGGGPGKVIPAQEKAGQAELVAVKDRLPIRGTVDEPEKRKQWEAAGFVFGGEIVEGRRAIFVEATFPAGWKLVPTDHPMWSSVVDAKGRKRAAVFFKAAFYDYNAHTFGLEKRYRAGGDKGGYDGKPYVLGVIDQATDAVVRKVWEWEDMELYYADRDREARGYEADLLIAEMFPDHKNPLAYWD